MQWYRVSLFGWIILSLFVWSLAIYNIYAEIIFTQNLAFTISMLSAIIFFASMFALLTKTPLFAQW